MLTSHPEIDPEVITPVLAAGVSVLSTTRRGGVGSAPYAGWNLGAHVGDSAAVVSRNRQLLHALLPSHVSIGWLQQVHGTRVVHASQAANAKADAVWSDDPAHACAVLTADCLPVVFAASDGSAVAVSHAGWRGLANGVLAATVAALPVTPDQLRAWLGPAIGPYAFQVGDEVRAAFINSMGAAADAAFRPDGDGRWRCDLYRLARMELTALGVGQVAGGDCCTLTDAGRFFSYRRDGATGRMATVAWCGVG